VAAAQQPDAGRRWMEVSIVATGKDNAPVQDLTQADITIKDNNKTQEIISFDKVTAGTPAVQGKPAIHNIVLLDCLNTTYSDTPQNRLEILKTLNELSKAENTTMLLLRQDLKILNGPGPSDPDLLRKFAKQGFDPAKPEAFNWVFTDETALGGFFTPTAVTDRVRFEAWLKWLKIIASNFQNRPGRKNLYWISQDFPLIMGETGAGYLEQAASQGAQGGAGRNDMFRMYATDIDVTAKMVANANLALYPIDARYLSRNPSAVSDRAKMSDLAKQTGGTAYASRQDVANCVKEAMGDSGTVFVARYAISDLKMDGKPHQVKVETKRKDVKLRARETYYAPQQAR